MNANSVVRSKPGGGPRLKKASIAGGASTVAPALSGFTILPSTSLTAVFAAHTSVSSCGCTSAMCDSMLLDLPTVANSVFIFSPISFAVRAHKLHRAVRSSVASKMSPYVRAMSTSPEPSPFRMARRMRPTWYVTVTTGGAGADASTAAVVCWELIEAIRIGGW